MTTPVVRTPAAPLVRAKHANETAPTAHELPAAPGDVRTVVSLLFAVTSLVALLAFGLTAYGMYGFAHHVLRYPAALAVAAAVIADLFSLCGLIATYALRRSPLRVRVYGWTVFLGFNAISVAGNEAFAVYRKLSMEGRVGAAVAPIALAFAVHLLVIVRRETERPSAAPERATERPVATRSERKSDPAIAPGRTDVPIETEINCTATDLPLAPERGVVSGNVLAAQDTERNRKSGRVAAQDGPKGKARRILTLDEKAAAVRRVLDGESPASVADDLGITTRAVQKWKEEHRNRTSSAPASLNGTAVDLAGVRHE